MLLGGAPFTRGPLDFVYPVYPHVTPLAICVQHNIPITLQYNIVRLLGQVAVYAKEFWPLTRVSNQSCPSLRQTARQKK